MAPTGTLSAAAAAANAAAASFAALTDSWTTWTPPALNRCARPTALPTKPPGQLRNSGEPYITHPIAVAAQCAAWKLDAQALMAALLHDAMEDCGVTKADLIDRFGAPWPSWWTVSPSWTSSNSTRAKRTRPSPSAKCCWPWRGMCASSSSKLADRTHNMRTLSDMPRSKWGRISSETLEIYAPLPTAWA